MNSTVRKGAILTAVLVVTASLASCQAGQSAATSQPYNPVDGRNVNVPADATFDENYIAIRNAVVVAIESDATLVVTIVNQSDESDVLESATLDDQDVELSGGPIELAPGQSVGLGYADNELATISGFEGSPGDWVDLTLRFTAAGDADLQVLVVPYGDQYVPVQFADGVRTVEEAS